MFSLWIILIHLTCCCSSAELFQNLPFKCPKKSFCGDNRCQGVLVVLLRLCPHQAVFALHTSFSALLLVICGFPYTNYLCFLFFLPTLSPTNVFTLEVTRSRTPEEGKKPTPQTKPQENWTELFPWITPKSSAAFPRKTPSFFQWVLEAVPQPVPPVCPCRAEPGSWADTVKAHCSSVLLGSGKQMGTLRTKLWGASYAARILKRIQMYFCKKNALTAFKRSGGHSRKIYNKSDLKFVWNNLLVCLSQKMLLPWPAVMKRRGWSKFVWTSGKFEIFSRIY